MYFQFSSARSEDFSAREGLVMRLMLKRLPGNRSPDNDRDASTSTVRWVRTILCPE